MKKLFRSFPKSSSGWFCFNRDYSSVNTCRRRSRLSSGRLRLATFVGVCLSALLLLLFAAPGFAADTRVVHGYVQEVTARLAPVGHLEGSKRLNLAIGLPLRDQAGLTRLIQELYDPAGAA